MKGLLRDFLPWILFSIMAGSSALWYDAAIIFALATTVIFDMDHLKKGFVLSWGTLLFFAVMLVLVVIFKNTWAMHNLFMMSNVVLAGIVIFSLLIKRPFTLQYAKEKMPEVFWSSPLFYKINFMISAVWGLAFILMAGLNFLPINSTVDQLLTYLPLIAAIGFTQKFPSWYRHKVLANRPVKQSAPNPDLMGNYAPVHDELNVENLMVSGEIPKDLNGVYMRNGPNPQFEPISYIFPFDGDGMIHAVYIKDGKASYKNRYVETKGLLKERKAGKALYGGVMDLRPIDPKWADPEDEPIAVKNGAFIHIIRHADQYLALWEGGPAYAMTRELQTLGEWKPKNTQKPINVGPHSRLDPITGELWFINYSIMPPYLNLYKLDKAGQLLQKWDIEKSHCTMIHDFVLTQNYVVIFDVPVVLDLALMMKGENLISWQPKLGTRIGIMPRSGGKMTWYDTEAFFVFHFANAYEQGQQIIVDYVRHDKLDLQSIGEGKGIPPMLYRSTINLQTGIVKNTQWDDRIVEFPRMREDLNTFEHQFIYLPTRTSSVQMRRALNGLIKYDVKNQRSVIHDFGANAMIGEAVFAPKANSQAEDDGYLMLFVYDSQTEQSELVILDAQNLNDKPLACIKMPRRIPVGLHGSWMPEGL